MLSSTHKSDMPVNTRSSAQLIDPTITTTKSPDISISLSNGDHRAKASPATSLRLIKNITPKSSPPPSSPALSVASILKRSRPHRTISTSSSSTLSSSPTASSSITTADGGAATADSTLRNNHISIVSLDDDDDDDGNCSSSIADSDSDLDNMSVNLSTLMANGMVHAPQSSADGIRSNGMIVINNGLPTDIIKSEASGSNGTAGNNRPHIGSIALQNSTDITFGDKTFYQGPVTVKQFFLEKDQWRRQESNTTTAGSSHSGTVPTTRAGADNAAFVSSSDDDGGEKRRRDGGTSSAHNGNISDDKNTPSASPRLDGRNCWKKLIQLERRPLVLSILVTLFLLFMAMVACVTYLLLVPAAGQHGIDQPGDGEDSRVNGPSNSTIGDDLLDTEFGTSLRFIPRVLWLAQPPKSRINDLESTANRLIIAHTATGPCETQAACTLSVRIIQSFHMDSMNWDDIGYNFLVGGDGAVYEGRGWDKEGAHTRGFNKKSICIAFIGTFISVLPPPRQIHAARILIEEGLLQHKLTADYRLYGHRQLMASESPGEALYHLIQTWPHWSNATSSSGNNARSVDAGVVPMVDITTNEIVNATTS